MILDGIYLEVETVLLEVLNVNFIPPTNMRKLGHVDLFNDQFANEEIEKAIKYPAILIEFSDIEWSTEGQGIQTGDLTVRFHIGQNILADTKAKAKFQAKGLVRLAYLEEIHKAVQGFSGPCFSKLDRIGTILDKAKTNKIVDIVEYATQVFDATADVKRNLIEKQAGLKIIKGSPPVIPPPDSPYIVDC